MTEHYFIVVCHETTQTIALSRRSGQRFDGEWRLLTRDEADELATAWNNDPTEGATATVVEVFRYEGDPSWDDGPSIWDVNPDFPLADWRYEVDNDDTRSGYREWVAHKRMEEE